MTEYKAERTITAVLQEEQQIDKLQRDNAELSLKLRDTNRRLGLAIEETKREIENFKHKAIIITGALGTGSVVLLIILIVALCCICQTWSKINFYHR